MLGGGTPRVVGSSVGWGVGNDYVLVEFDGNDGEASENARYNGTGNGEDIPVAFASFDGAYYVTGTSAAAAGSDIVTIKYVDLKDRKYRTLIQDSLAGAAAKLKKTGITPNCANVRDEAFLVASPKIKKGYAGAPGGLVLGNVRTDSATLYGWIRIDKAKALTKFMPHTGTARGFDAFSGTSFVGWKKSPTLVAHNNHLLGELIALRMSIAASDAGISPPTLGDLTYDDGDTENSYNGKTLRQLASFVDNVLTYHAYYSGVDYALLDSMMARINRAFTGPLGIVSTTPLSIWGAVHIDSVLFLTAANEPLAHPISIPSEAIEQIPLGYELHQNYPNPFNPSTTIEFDLPEAAFVSLKVYDMLGREVATLLDDQALEEGRQEVLFTASDFASGVYYYRLKVDRGAFQKINKMVLL